MKMRAGRRGRGEECREVRRDAEESGGVERNWEDGNGVGKRAEEAK